MDSEQLISNLKTFYPGKDIVTNGKTELICEIDPTRDHPDYSVALAIIDQSLPHYHLQSTEIYEVMEGELKLAVDEKVIILRTGDRYVIEPGHIHSAQGNATTVRVISRPGWNIDDQFST